MIAEQTEKKRLNWRWGFALFAVIYAGGLSALGVDNFAKVHGEYRQAKVNLRPERIEEIARASLVDQCRRQIKKNPPSRPAGASSPVLGEDPCRAFPEAVLVERQQKVASELRMEVKRFFRKIVVFSTTFALVFLALPLGLLYLVLSFLVWLFRDMKFVR